MIHNRSVLLPALLVGSLLTLGCGGGATTPPAGKPNPPADAAATIAAERAKLSAEDRALVEAQEWCVISTDERLGSMGPPLKLDIKGQPVFICCEGCKRSAEANPDKTLAKVAELKAKAAAEKEDRKK
jgi:hypothetical protein